VQGTAEGEPFSQQQLFALLESAQKGIADIVAAQKQALS
jgi:ribonuclease PH